MKTVFEDICKMNDATLEEFYGEADHVYHPSRIALSVLVNSLKGVSSRRLRQNFDIFKKEYWGENVALWSRSYFVASVY